MKNKLLFKHTKLGLIIAFVLFSSLGWGQVNITPIRTDVSGFISWTDTSINGTTYLQLLSAGANTISPEMNFNSYTAETLNFKARTFGGSTPAEIILTVWISVDNGGSWTNIGTRTPSSASLLAQTSFDISSYSGTQVKVKFSVAGTSNAIGVGIDDISITGILSGAAPPSLSPDGTSNDVDNNLDVTFTDDATWRAAVTAVKIGTTALSASDYTLSSGNLQLKPSIGNVLLTTSGSKTITVEATGYTTASFNQIINAGAPTSNSTATINSALALGASRTITCTAKDQYNNLVTGYAFKYDVVLLDSNVTTDESYTIDGTATASDINNQSIVSTTNSSGIATFITIIPSIVDANDGISVQVQLGNGSTNIGTAFTFTQLAPQITFTSLDPGNSSIQQNTINNVLYRIQVDVTNNSTDLNSVLAITSGNYLSTDIVSNGFKLWYSTDALFGGDVNIKSVSSTSSGSGEILTFSSFSQTFTVGTAYLFITVDVSETATVSKTISAEATVNGDFSFSSPPTFSGSSFNLANLHSISTGPTTLQAGDIAFIGYQFDEPDTYSFILLKNVTENTLINFTDNAWTGSALNSNEGTTTWTAPNGGLLKGTSITISGNTVTGGGSATSSSSLALSTSGDQIIAYQGSSTSPNIIAAVSSTAYISTGTTNTNNTFLPSGLTENITAISFATDLDNGYYNGITTGTLNILRSAINNSANWVTNNSLQTFPAWNFSIGSSTVVNKNTTIQESIISNGESLLINSGFNITVTGAITNNGSFTVENNANLIQGGTTNTNSGNVIVNRDSALINLYDYTLWSSPVAGQKLKAFSPNTLDTRFYSYNSGTNLYNVVPLPATTDFARATGYLIRTPNTWTAGTPNTFNGIFTGVPNNGDISVTGLLSGKYYAVGNPYPSTINVAAFYLANPNAGTLYFWRKTNGALVSSAYATRNSLGETAAPGGLTPSPDIAVGQGFFVSPSADMTLNFTNAMRVTPSTSAVFLRTTQERSRYWLNLTTTSGAFSQMLVGYMPEATSGVDNSIDGKYINDAPIALTSIINAEEYTIQGRALPFATTDTVPLGFKTNAAGNYTIAIDHVDGLFSNGQTVFLKDNLLSTVTDLSAGSYSFASAIGTFNSRFEVVYQNTLAVTNPTFTANSVIAFSANGEIRINSGSTIMELVRVYDLQGRLLVEKKQINASETTIATTATNQVLLVEVTAANGSKITKKIIQ